MKIYGQQISRRQRLASLRLARLLRRVSFNFDCYPRVATIAGDYIGDQIRAHGRYEERHLALLAGTLFERNGIAIDVGANIGNHTLFLARYFDSVIAFEPNPLARALLEINLTINGISNVKVEPVGLSDRSARASLISDHTNLGATRIAGGDKYNDLADLGTRPEIELVTGDERIGSATSVRFIKVDIEGHEYPALLGLKETISRQRPAIMIEQLREAIDAHGSSEPDQFLRSLGYTPHMIMSVPSLKPAWLLHLYELIVGRVVQRLVPLRRLEQRDYTALIYLPAEIMSEHRD